MESIDAKKLALTDIVTSMVAQEKSRILRLMEDDLSKMGEAYCKSLLESTDQEIKQEEVNQRLASIIICRAARYWLARLSVIRKCEDNFDKEFDEEYRVFFYRNKNTVRDSARVRFGFKSLFIVFIDQSSCTIGRRYLGKTENYEKFRYFDKR